ncbi:hypothetical protein ACSSS7_002175 [Eimeria intestinalis]
MGGDGGSFSGRAEMVKTKGFKFLRNLGGMGYTPNTQIRAGDERLGKNENRDLQNSACALSEEPLKPPLVACRVGRLYNKESVITAMLEKSLPPHMKHVKSLKDLKGLKVEINAATGFPVCPITKADLSSGVRASIIWPCGSLVSNRALDAMTSKDSESARPESDSREAGRPKIKGSFVCPMCSEEHNAAEDLIPLSPDEDEIPALLEKALAQHQAKKAAKKQRAAKGESASKAEPASPPTDQGPATTPSDDAQSKKGKGASQSPSREVVSEKLPRGPPPKRIRDWVIEFESGAAPTAEIKQRKVAA